MITIELVKEGLDTGRIRLITDPVMEMGTVCAIGDNWFYFGGITAEEMEPVNYNDSIPKNDIVQEIYDTLTDFVKDEVLLDEYMYYEEVLRQGQ